MKTILLSLGCALFMGVCPTAASETGGTGSTSIDVGKKMDVATGEHGLGGHDKKLDVAGNGDPATTKDGKRLDLYDTGGTIPAGGKKLDFAASGTADVKLPNEVRKIHSLRLADTGGNGQDIGLGKKMDVFAEVETAGISAPGLSGKSGLAAVFTGGTGGVKLPPDGKKQDHHQMAHTARVKERGAYGHGASVATGGEATSLSGPQKKMDFA